MTTLGINGPPVFKGKSFAPKRASAPNINSWDQALTAGQTLTGAIEEVTLYPSVSIAVLTDGPGTVYLEQSTNGIDFDDIEAVLVPANLNTKFVRTITRRFYRTIFVSSSGSAHTFFRLQTMYGDFTSDGLGTGTGGQALRSSDLLVTGTEASLSSGSTATIVTLTPAVDTFITKVICSGHDYAKFTLVLNSSVIATRRSGPSRDVVWSFDGSPLRVAASSVLDVKVIHFLAGATPDFESSILGYS